MARMDSGDLAVRETHINNLTGIASTTMTKFNIFAKSKLKRVSALVVTAGTNAAAGVDVYIGTTSVAAITVGTSTAGSVADTGTLNLDIPTGSFIDIRGKATSATMVLSLAVVTQPQFDATLV